MSILGDADAASDEVSAVLRAAPDLLVMNTGVHYARELNLSSAGTALEFTLFTAYTRTDDCTCLCTQTHRRDGEVCQEHGGIFQHPHEAAAEAEVCFVCVK